MNTEGSHIVFLTPGFAESEMDSTTIPALQVYLKSLRKALSNTKMTVLTFQFPFSNKTYDWHGIKVIPLKGSNKRYKKLYTWKKALQSLKEINSKKPITTIHSFWIGECSLIGNRFLKKHSIKHITTVMGQDVNIGNRYVKSLINTSTKVITLSENQKIKLFENYGVDSTIIPWHLDTESFSELQNISIDILGVGSLNKIKNYSVFINIIDGLAKTTPKLKVEIIGEGKMRIQLEKTIKERHLINNITLIGKLPREQVLKKMSQAKLLLHTSTYESFGFVFLESLYAGMQIVSFNVGIAKAIPEWQICKSKKEMEEACKLILSAPKKEKKRIRLIQEDTCVSSYIKLYNE